MNAAARKFPQRSRGRRKEDQTKPQVPRLPMHPEERWATRITNALKLAVPIVTRMVILFCAGIGGYVIVVLKWKEAASLLK